MKISAAISMIMNNVRSSEAVNNIIQTRYRRNRGGIRLTPQQAGIYGGVFFIGVSLFLIFRSIQQNDRNKVLRSMCFSRTTARVFLTVDSKKVLRYVDYTVDGKNYNNRINSMFQRKYHDRDLVTIVYNQNNPDQFYLEDSKPGLEFGLSIASAVLLFILGVLSVVSGFTILA